MNKKIGIIIVNYNGRRYLNGLFFSLAQVDYDGEWEIVFIDNASTDNSLDYVKERFLPKFSNLKIIESKDNLGFAGGNNIGMEYLIKNNFNYAYLLNQDTVVDRDFLKNVVKHMKEGVGSVQSKLLLFDKEDASNSLGNAMHFLGFGYCFGYGMSKENTKKYLEGWQKRDKELNIAYGSGAGLLLNIEILKKVGLFEDYFFMYHEDLDLGWRMRLAGYRNVLAPDSVVYHKYEFSKSIQKYYWMERNRFIVLFQNFNYWTLFLISPALILMELGTLFFAIKSGWWKEKIKVYKYFLQSSSWKKIQKGREHIKSIRKKTDEELSDIFIGKILFQDMDNWVLKNIANPFFNFYWKIIRFFV